MKKPNMKIVIVSLNGMKAVGGVERVVYYLHQIFSSDYHVQILQKKKSFGKFDALLYPLLFSLRLFFTRNKIVFSQSWQSFLYPVDFSIHHGTTLGYTNRIPEVKSFGSQIISFMEKMSARNAKRVLAVSENCRNELVSLYRIKPKKITVLNNFVNEAEFYPINTAHKGTGITLLFSGRLENSKGLQDLETLSAYIEGLQDVRLRIACNSAKNTELFADRKHTEVCVGLSFNQMNDFYNSGNILYFPTRYEGFSMSTLEALASGIPVIGTNFAVPEELQKYDFVQVCELFTPPQCIVDAAFSMAKRFAQRKQEIHDAICCDFGYEQYTKKLFSYMTGT